MNLTNTIDRIREDYQKRKERLDVDGGWKTIKGTHVYIGEEGKIEKGPKRLKNLPKLGDVDKSTKSEYNKLQGSTNEKTVPSENQLSKNFTPSQNEVIDGIVGKTRLSREAVENLVTDMQNESIHNPDAEYMMLGKGHNGGENSYVNKAEKNGDSYFSMGDRWDKTKAMYGLTDDQMFDVFNAAALDHAMKTGKKIRFCDEPKLDGSGLSKEVKYLQDKFNAMIIKEGDYWYAE